MNKIINTPSLLEDIGETIGYAEIYAERRIQLAKLEAAEKTATVTASLVTSIALGSFLLLIFGTLSLALGFYLKEALSVSYAQAFLLLGGVQSLLLILLYLVRHQLFTNPILEQIIKMLFRK